MYAGFFDPIRIFAPDRPDPWHCGHCYNPLEKRRIEGSIKRDAQRV